MRTALWTRMAHRSEALCCHSQEHASHSFIPGTITVKTGEMENSENLKVWTWELHPNIRSIFVCLWWLSWKNHREASSDSICSNALSSTSEAHSGLHWAQPSPPMGTGSQLPRVDTVWMSARTGSHRKWIICAASHSFFPCIIKKHIPQEPRMDKWSERAVNYRQ